MASLMEVKQQPQQLVIEEGFPFYHSQLWNNKPSSTIVNFCTINSNDDSHDDMEDLRTRRIRTRWSRSSHNFLGWHVGIL